MASAIGVGYNAVLIAADSLLAEFLSETVVLTIVPQNVIRDEIDGINSIRLAFSQPAANLFCNPASHRNFNSMFLARIEEFWASAAGTRGCMNSNATKL